MCNIISLAPDQRTRWLSTQAMEPVITSLAVNRGVRAFLAVCYLEVKLYWEVWLGPEQSVRYSELGGCPPLGGFFLFLFFFKGTTH